MAFPTYGYCSVDDVCAPFPFFQRNAPNSVTDEEIKGWIGDRKARIRSAFLTRGFDPDSPPNTITTDQTNFLRALNRDGAAADLATALQGSVTLQAGEYSVAQARNRSYENVLKEITNALHDALFNTGPLGNTARTVDVTPLVQGVGGAETDPTQTPAVLEQNRLFGKNMLF